jgi:DNA ligase (NAD+)
MIKAPTNCPSCNSLLKTVGDQLYCTDEGCGDKKYKAVEHFCATLKIKGLGPANIRKLDIRDIQEIYTLELPEGKTWDNIAEEIEKSKKAPLNLVLPALGIPLVGKTAAGKLANVITNIYEINETSCKEAGLGITTTTNLLDFLSTFDYDLPFTYEFARSSSTNGVVCITGSLSSYKNKAEATKVLEARGYAVRPTVTKEVTIVIHESGKETAKVTKARESGITIVTNLKQFLGE